jgi:2-hydroxychromene-2-carboxylate isomerase
MENVRVYIDFKSPYSFVAVKPLIELAQAEAVLLDWRPFTLQLQRAYARSGARADVGADVGADTGANADIDAQMIYSMRKIRYLYQDVRRFAKPQGLIIKGPERIFDGTVSSIGMLYAQQQAVFDAYRDTVFERFFKRDLNIDSADEIAAVIRSAGGDSSAFAAFLEGEGSAQHAAIQAEAEQAGVFGIPTMVFRDELFWGADRIELLRERIGSR